MIEFSSKTQIDNYRNVGLDVFRWFNVLGVFVYHISRRMNFDFPILNAFAHNAAICMSGFFMLSGFVMYMNYHKLGDSLIEIIDFYKKRYLSLLIPYFIFCVLYYVLLKKNDIFTEVILLPIELLGWQMFFSDFSRFTHNAGTWFISCFVLSYFMFPYIKKFIEYKKWNLKLLIGIEAFCIYIPFVTVSLGTAGVYNNPIYRTMEFILGMLIAHHCLSNECNYSIPLVSSIPINYIVFVLVINILYSKFLPDNIMISNFISIPCFSYILYLSFYSRKHFQRSGLSFLNGSSYEFFWAQYFSFPIIALLTENCSTSLRFVGIVICNILLCLVLKCIVICTNHFIVKAIVMLQHTDKK